MVGDYILPGLTKSAKIAHSISWCLHYFPLKLHSVFRKLTVPHHTPISVLCNILFTFTFPVAFYLLIHLLAAQLLTFYRSVPL